MLRIFLSLFLMIVVNPASAKTDVLIFKDQSKLCIASNSVPDHEIGKFPNRANPHSIREHLVEFCMPIDPVKNKVPKFVKGTIGIAINGIQFRPNTAGFYDPRAKSGHSRDGDKRWSLDIFGAKNKLGLDQSNGHIGPNGLYHYHGIAKSLEPYYKDVSSYDTKAIDKFLSDNTILHDIKDLLLNLEDWNEDDIDIALKAYQADNNLSVPKVNQPIRIALTGSIKSPSLGLTLYIFGKDLSIKRIQDLILFTNR